MSNAASALPPAFNVVAVVYCSHSDKYRVPSHVVLIYISLMANDDEHLL